MDAAVRGVLERVAEAARDLSPGDLRDAAPFYASILALFDRCHGLFLSIRTLVDEGRPQEALILARPLLTDSLALQELAGVDERRRAELVIAWERSTLVDLEGVFREGQKQGRDADEVLGLLRRRRDALDSIAHTAGFKKKAWRPDRQAKDLAREHGRSDEYLDLLFLHQFVHGSQFAAAQRYTTPREGVVWVGDHAAAAESWATSAALSAAQSFLYAMQSICTLWDLPKPAELAELLKRIEDLAPPEPSHADGSDKPKPT